MTTHKRTNHFISALLCILIILASINLINCGGGGNGGGPVISTMSPASALSSSTTVSPNSITLIGANFGTTQSALSYVYFNKVLTPATAWSDATIVATIPPIVGLAPGNTASVPVVVSINGLVSNAVTFTYIGS